MTGKENTVFVGGKEVRDYGFSVFTLAKKYDELNIIARGSHIKKAVDASQFALNSYLKDMDGEWSIENTEVGTDIIEADDGGEIRVSTIAITMKKEEE